MRVIEAARIMEKGYEDDPPLDIIKKLNKKGAQAYLLRDRTMVVPGTNQLSDWLQYNLQVSVRLSTVQMFTMRSGASGMKWHGGFLTHAERLYKFAKKHKPKRLIGHSLGAASVQIVGASLRIPTFAFASPRPKFGPTGFRGSNWVLNILRSDDFVTRIPPERVGFHHVGYTRTLTPPKKSPGMDHKMHHYITLLANSKVSKNVPKVWPPAR